MSSKKLGKLLTLKKNEEDVVIGGNKTNGKKKTVNLDKLRKKFERQKQIKKKTKKLNDQYRQRKNIKKSVYAKLGSLLADFN